MKFLSLLLLLLGSSPGTALPSSAAARALRLPKELQGVDPAALATCGGGTGFCSAGHCLCSGICEGVCEWYECGAC
jgi:hypothetical protein